MTARLDYWNREFDTAFRRLRWHLRYDELVQRAEAFADVLRKYAPDQPRIPAGQSGGGQWTAGSGGLVRVAGGFKPEHMQMTVQQFRSKYCQGNIQKKIPGEFLNITIEQLLIEEQKGTPHAYQCYKLLNEDRFRK